MLLIDRRSARGFDWSLFATLALLLAGGCLLVSSATANRLGDLSQRQLLWSLLSLLLAAIVALVDYRKLADRAYLAWGVLAALLVVLLLVDPQRAGVNSWFALGSFGLQPSEFAKIVLILALARCMAERDPLPFGFTGLGMPAVLVGVPFLLIALQPDLGTASTFLPIAVGIIWVAGIRWQAAAKLAGWAAAAAPLGYFFLRDYQRERLLSFLNPEADPLNTGYQVVQSKIAIGSGGIFGKGLFSGSQSQLQFLPAQHTDLIFAVLGEELGFLGVATVILLYLALLLRVLQTARLSRDRLGAFLCSGVATLLLYHLVINVAMVIGWAPITGIPLPLLSYGGSSALSTGLAVGLVLSVRSRRFLN